ncbi:HD domain-containing protein [Pseudomonas gingeri]|uniref:HD domain-containing protein n=1 Tax=Pseudomonas gingeri TaxID=117681 RepID=UPI00159FA07C|nr:HD domain-containing protein [Pseudomonas gingeri]NVZ99372.1 HD domain-containing protein [Pseudomonas gingeri]NWA13417.1 HD domain-containing protein [Pseudomonas gingeri]NWA55678.1 HD domain-containing protein [Pseudomonas gingeri]NWA95468.1 HD domain-containing protein [Pseudomonas gingeri]NWB00555.1 HD domain-containing protein [Pseudomonas gingeri]
MTALCFAPRQSLAERLLDLLPVVQGDGSHDLSHIHRVWKNACAIQREEGGDLDILIAATLLHDCVAVEKDSPLRSRASRLSAEKASALLVQLGWPEQKIFATAHAIEAHSFSAAIIPTTLEARILQDADRLDALGMVGVARCFYVGGRLGHSLYDPVDPLAQHREHDDQRFSLDHFQTKLLHLASGFQTATGTRLAAIRHERLQRFMEDFMEEIGV